MSPEHYDKELKQLSATYEKAMAAVLDEFKAAVAGASESSVISVGSGGSFTVASLLSNLHEAYTGRVSRPSTPLELICNPNLASSSPVFLVSAEGKNPDIVEALHRARLHSARTIHVLTNRRSSPLVDAIARLTNVNSHVFELTEKDGFLATNSLLMDAVLVARAYQELDGSNTQLPAEFDQLTIGESRVGDWIEKAGGFAEETIKRGALIVVFSPLLRPIAADLESKLAEAAICHCQLADLRSFAHGRHLWLAERSSECTVLALVEPTLNSLWQQMRDLFPVTMPTLTLNLAGSSPQDLIAGLVTEMQLVSVLARNRNMDPAKPYVPQFGRQLYYLDLVAAIPPPKDDSAVGEQTKGHVLGSKWPFATNRETMRRARRGFESAILQQSFRALVFDYDGTLANSQHGHDDAPPAEIMQTLERLARSGVLIGIASGRGGSIQERLAEIWSKDLLSVVTLGLYNGGWIASAAEHPDSDKNARPVSEFLSHVTRLLRKLQTYGVPIEAIRPIHPYQVSVRFRRGLATQGMWFVLADTLRQAGLTFGRMVCSKHSIDILAPEIDKSRLVAHMIHAHHIDPYEVLTLGDQGAWPGNDSSLLEHRFSLSVDVPSRRLDRGWKLAPEHKRDVDATSWYLERIRETAGGRFNLTELT